MFRFQAYILHAFLLCFTLLITPVAHAYNEVALEDSVVELKKVQSRLEKNKFNSDDLTEWTRLDSIKGLGEKSKSEDKNITSVRKLLTNDKTIAEKGIADCNVHIVLVDKVEKLLAIAKDTDIQRVYFSAQKSVIVLISDFISNPADLFTDSSDFIFEHSGIRNIKPLEWLMGGILLTVVLLIAFRIRSHLIRYSQTRSWNDDLDNLLLHSAITTAARYLPYFLVSLCGYLFLIYTTYNTGLTLFITQFCLAVTLYFLFIAVSSFVLSPVSPAKPVLENMQDKLIKVSQRLNVLFLTALLGYLAFYTVFSDSMTETNLQLLRLVFSLVVVINLVWTIRVLVDPDKLPKLSWIARVVNLLLLLTLVSEWMGYINLSLAVRGGVLITFVLLLVFIGLSKVFQLIFNSLDTGSNRIASRIRKNLDVNDDSVIPGLIWLRLTFFILLWGVFLLLLVNIWDFNGGLLTLLKNYIVNGFTISEYRIVPGKILWAIILFSALLAVSGWIKCQLEKHWLAMINIDSGARDAVVTISGYIMFLLSILIGLKAAGFDFGNIAIIAGALSVGIGFGLQNIVNNFVSGLILLFERPIRKGDWVEVGSTEGFVKNIQIRSTLIRTFDNSDVIVPNSELISNQVTNWMLSSKKGRAIVPVGVAYGTDIEKVRDILLQIANDNEKLIHGENRWAPKVLFRAFGDSSLDI